MNLERSPFLSPRRIRKVRRETSVFFDTVTVQRTSSSLLSPILLRQSVEGHVLRNGVVRYQHVPPRFCTIDLGVRRRILTPLFRNILFGNHIWSFHLIGSLRLQHVKRVVSLRYEVGLILQMVRSLA